MLKFIGLLGIVTALGLYGIMKSGRLAERIKLLEDFLQMVLELKGQISYFKEPLPVIFSKVNKDKDSAGFSLLKDVETQLKEKDAEIGKIWRQRVNEAYRGKPLTKDDLQVMEYLGSFIGQTDYDNQLFHFSYMEAKLGEQMEEGKASLKTKGPMYRKIGFFIGAIIAILLI